MFNKGMFQQTSQSQTTGDEQFVQQGKKKPANLGKGLKMILVFFLGLFLVFSLLQCVYSLEEDEYAVIRTWGMYRWKKHRVLSLNFLIFRMYIR